MTKMKCLDIFENKLIVDVDDYKKDLKSFIMDYLITFLADGKIKSISMDDFVSFLGREGFDVTPEMVIKLLDGTDFNATIDKIEIGKKSSMGPMNATKRKEEMSKRHVKSLANKKIESDIKK